MKLEDIDILEEAFDIDAGKKVLVKQLMDMAEQLDKMESSSKYDTYKGASGVRATVKAMQQFKKDLNNLQKDIDTIEKMAKKV